MTERSFDRDYRMLVFAAVTARGGRMPDDKTLADCEETARKMDRVRDPQRLANLQTFAASVLPKGIADPALRAVRLFPCPHCRTNIEVQEGTDIDRHLFECSHRKETPA